MGFILPWANGLTAGNESIIQQKYGILSIKINENASYKALSEENSWIYEKDVV